MKVSKYNNCKNISGSKIREFRLKAKLSQEMLAARLQLQGISLTAKEISKLELNHRLILDFELFAIADILNIPTDYLRP